MFSICTFAIVCVYVYLHVYLFCLCMYMCVHACICACMHACVFVCVCVCVCVHGSNFMCVIISLCSYFFILTKWAKQSLQRDNSLRSSTEQLIPPADDQSINNTGMYVHAFTHVCMCLCPYECEFMALCVSVCVCVCVCVLGQCAWHGCVYACVDMYICKLMVIIFIVIY